MQRSGLTVHWLCITPLSQFHCCPECSVANSMGLLRVGKGQDCTARLFPRQYSGFFATTFTAAFRVSHGSSQQHPGYRRILRDSTGTLHNSLRQYSGYHRILRDSIHDSIRDRAVLRDNIQGTTGFFMTAPVHRRILRNNTQGITGFFVTAFKVNM